MVDAYAAVVLAQQQFNPSNPDMYIADTITDFGVEPSTATVAWNSPDIWVRNQQDNLQTHQSPLYNPTNPNYVHVKVRNRGCNPSTGNDVIKVYANLPNQLVPTSSYRISNPFFKSDDSSSIIANTFSFQENSEVSKDEAVEKIKKLL